MLKLLLEKFGISNKLSGMDSQSDWSKFGANYVSLILEKTCNLLFIMVPGAGVEPARCCHRGILSPLRLPVSPPGLDGLRVPSATNKSYL